MRLALGCERGGLRCRQQFLLVDSDLIDRADWQALLQFHGYQSFYGAKWKGCVGLFFACSARLSPDGFGIWLIFRATRALSSG